MTRRTWTPGEKIGGITLTLTLLGIVCGAAWWMSAMYSSVSAMEKNMGRAMETLVDHEGRISKLEK